MKPLQEHIELLREYNRWRRGEDENQTMPCPRQVGRAIDAVCDHFRDATEKVKTAKFGHIASDFDSAKAATTQAPK